MSESAHTVEALTVAEARRQVREHRNDPAGVICPACDQLAKVYRRRITSSMALVLIHLAQRARKVELGALEEFVHVPSFINELPYPPRVRAAIRGDWAKLVHWGFIEALPTVRQDGSKRNGWWRVTDKGKFFARGHKSAAKFVYITNARAIGVSDETVTIVQALGAKFDYAALMAAGGVE